MSRPDLRLPVGIALALSGIALCVVPAASARPRLVKRVAKTTMEASASKDAEGNVTATVSLYSSQTTCLNAGRVLTTRSNSGQPVGPPVYLGYGPELLQVERGPWSVEHQGEPSEGVAYGANPDKTYDFSLASVSAPEVSPWVWQGSWPAAEKTGVRSENGTAPRGPTVGTATFVHIAMILFLHSKLYVRGSKRELIVCPGKKLSEWIAL
jgi:hypothetical protein